MFVERAAWEVRNLAVRLGYEPLIAWIARTAPISNNANNQITARSRQKASSPLVLKSRCRSPARLVASCPEAWVDPTPRRIRSERPRRCSSHEPKPCPRERWSWRAIKHLPRRQWRKTRMLSSDRRRSLTWGLWHHRFKAQIESLVNFNEM